MTRLNREYLRGEAERGGHSPALTPAMVVGQPDELWVTIMSHRLLRNGTLVQLEFREYPGHILWVGGHGAAAAREAGYLGDQCGDDSARWNGARLKLEKVRRQDTRNGGEVVKYVVAPPDNGEADARQVAPPEPATRKLRPRKPRKATSAPENRTT